MEKTAQNPSGAPRRRRRRRGSGAGASQNTQASASRENGKPAQPAAREKAPRPQPSRKENKEAAQAAPAARGRHRGAQQAEPAAQTQPSGRRRGNGGNGNNGGQPVPAREQNHSQKPSTRAARAQHRAAEEDPGLELITRRPPKQKFANFEEYLAAHGGMTVPLPDDAPAPAEQAAEGAAE